MVQLSFGRPSRDAVDRTVREGLARGFCFPHPGQSKDFPPLSNAAAKYGYQIDHNRVKLGYGGEVYEKAKKVLNRWGHFQLGWAEVDPTTPVETGTGVCVQAKVLFLWTRNPLSITYVDEKKKSKKQSEAVFSPEGAACKSRYTYAHGCLHGHMLAGEERFAVEWLEADNSVWYDVAAFSKPAGPLCAMSYPFVRLFQRRFGISSMKAMTSSVEREL
mmetsp:Transcript_4551/g.8484  ORF Transcript_4551/g.8484 Transcript_4551/m.8484 type:complete len:217 (+) Transcript_4551:157-807(+)